jgi:hypothetical protein
MTVPSFRAASAADDDLLTGLLRLVSAARPNADKQLISGAYDVAAYCHQGQNRKSGDPYITHPVAVASILAETGADDQLVCAALLHDVVEDTPYTQAALRERFGAEIAGLVDALAALDRMPPSQWTAACADGGADLDPASDTRVLLLKLADRLHNMRTLRHMSPAKQLLNSTQTLEVMVPVARALRMDAIGLELESLASATLRRRHKRPGTASGHLLAATAAFLPAASRARWREEWLAELHTLPTRRARIVFAAQVAFGIGQLAVTLYQPASAFKRICGAVLATLATASTFTLGGWKAAAAFAAAALAVLATLVWVLRSDDRTARLAKLISALRGTAHADPIRRDQGHRID